MPLSSGYTRVCIDPVRTPRAVPLTMITYESGLETVKDMRLTDACRPLIVFPASEDADVAPLRIKTICG